MIWILGTGVGLIVVLFRLASFRRLSNDHFMHLAWAQQLVFGALPGRDFVDPGMPLVVAASALAQSIAKGPFAEALLCATALGVAAAMTCVVTARLTSSLAAGAGAALATAAFVPRLYNYPKVLVPVVVLWLVQRYVDQPTDGRLRAVAGGIVWATLCRHDLGVYAAAAVTVALGVFHRRAPRRAVSAGTGVAVWALAWALPYLAYVSWSEGLGEHLRRSSEFARSDAHQLHYARPRFPSLDAGTLAWTQPDAVAAVYYAALALPVLGLPLLRRLATPGSERRLPVAAASVAFLALYLLVILRHPLDARLPDVATPFVLVAAWLAHGAMRTAMQGARYGPSPGSRAAWAAFGAAALTITAVVVVNVGVLARVANAIDEADVWKGPSAFMARLRAAGNADKSPDGVSSWENAPGQPPLVPYLRACTAPDSPLLLTWPAPEYFLFAERRFASGHPTFLAPSAFTTDADQAFMIERLERERPPVALINETRRAEFAAAYPRVDALLRAQYRAEGLFETRAQDQVSISVRVDLQPTAAYGEGGWPCGFVEPSQPGP